MAEEKTQELVDPRNIIGYESPQCLEILASLICALKRGIKLPPVELVKITESEYHIPYKEKFEYKEGGHHRALAYYLLGKEQPSIILEATKNPSLIIPESSRIQIPKLTVVQNWRLFMEHVDFKRRLEGVEYIQPTLEDIEYTINLYNASLDQPDAEPNWP